MRIMEFAGKHRLIGIRRLMRELKSGGEGHSEDGSNEDWLYPGGVWGWRGVAARASSGELGLTLPSCSKRGGGVSTFPAPLGYYMHVSGDASLLSPEGPGNSLPPQVNS